MDAAPTDSSITHTHPHPRHPGSTHIAPAAHPQPSNHLHHHHVAPTFNARHFRASDHAELVHRPAAAVHHQVEGGGRAPRTHQLQAADARVRQEQRGLRHRRGAGERGGRQAGWRGSSGSNSSSKPGGASKAAVCRSACSCGGNVQLASQPAMPLLTHCLEEAEGGGQGVEEALARLDVCTHACSPASGASE